MKNYLLTFILGCMVFTPICTPAVQAVSFKNIFCKKNLIMHDYVAEDNLLENYMQVPFAIIFEDSNDKLYDISYKLILECEDDTE